MEISSLCRSLWLVFGGMSVRGWRLISSMHAVEGQSGTPKVTAALHLRKNRKLRFGCFFSFIDSATIARGMHFKFPLKIQPNTYWYCLFMKVKVLQDEG